MKVANIKTSAAIAKKWADVTPGRSGDFESGVKDSTVDWAGPTAAAEGSYADGVSSAISEKRFGKGVGKAGTEKWRRKTVETGVGRWGAGVRAAQTDMQAGITPYREAIAGVTLPPRFSRGDPRNLDRVAAIAKTLHDLKTKG